MAYFTSSVSTVELPRRYLVQFDARRLTHYFTDVLVIGGGLAGLRATLAVPPGLDVLVVTKSALGESNSQYAQGGIAGVLDPEDRFENHVEDTLTAGAGLCDRAIVEAVIRVAPQRLLELIAWGAQFDADAAGKLALGLEGGHSHARIVHALGDATGAEVMRAVIAKTKSAANVVVWENSFTLDLLTDDDDTAEAAEGDVPAVVGALVCRPQGERVCVWARQTILASGGVGRVYRETTNPAVATGDGLAIAYRAGARLADMEFMQFHPTALYVAGTARHLISEAVRGEGAFLRDKTGHRFMVEADPRAELAPRDIVARAIVRQMEATQHPFVYLDLAHLPPERIRARFPGIDRLCRSFDLDLTRDRLPVRPAAHYTIGGVRVDNQGRTSMAGLWACGEVTSSGLHGANRLASNSLLEGLVYGAWCGEGTVAALDGRPARLRARGLASRFRPERRELDLIDLRNSLRSLMGRVAGITRTAAGLALGLQELSFWRRYVLTSEFNEATGWELQNLLTIATLILLAADRREESRGAHYRADHPLPSGPVGTRLDSPAAVFTSEASAMV